MSLYVTNINLDGLIKRGHRVYESYYNPDVDAKYEKLVEVFHEINMLGGEVDTEASKNNLPKYISKLVSLLKKEGIKQVEERKEHRITEIYGNF